VQDFIRRHDEREGNLENALNEIGADATINRLSAMGGKRSLTMGLGVP